MRVGIEAIAFDLPKFFIDMTELARARGVDPAKFTQGLGQTEMSVISPCEDTVTLAASAGLKLIKKYNIDPNSIALIIVGTETAVDHSKPISSHVHEILNLPTNCRAFEVKHACYGATAGIAMATDWIMSRRAKGKKALVIASDIARYGAGTAGEPTQGAGAVAMLISDEPKLLEFETSYQGYFSSQVMDFWRPTYSKEAFADGHFSIQCYLDALTAAFKMYKENYYSENAAVANADDLIINRFAANLYHVPFVKMAQKAHQKLTEIETRKTIEKGTPEFEGFTQDFAQRVAPNLHLNSRVGNIYTGSLYLSLFNLLEERSAELAGKAISLFSYGSGCTAEFFSGIILPQAAETIKCLRSEDILRSRIKISIERYEQLLEESALADYNGAGVSDPARWDIMAPILYLGTKNHQRHYQHLATV